MEGLANIVPQILQPDSKDSGGISGLAPSNSSLEDSGFLSLLASTLSSTQGASKESVAQNEVSGESILIEAPDTQTVDQIVPELTQPINDAEGQSAESVNDTTPINIDEQNLEVEFADHAGSENIADKLSSHDQEPTKASEEKTLVKQKLPSLQEPLHNLERAEFQTPGNSPSVPFTPHPSNDMALVNNTPDEVNIDEEQKENKGHGGEDLRERIDKSTNNHFAQRSQEIIAHDKNDDQNNILNKNRDLDRSNLTEQLAQIGRPKTLDASNLNDNKANITQPSSFFVLNEINENESGVVLGDNKKDSIDTGLTEDLPEDLTEDLRNVTLELKNLNTEQNSKDTQEDLLSTEDLPPKENDSRSSGITAQINDNKSHTNTANEKSVAQESSAANTQRDEIERNQGRQMEPKNYQQNTAQEQKAHLKNESNVSKIEKGELFQRSEQSEPDTQRDVSKYTVKAQEDIVQYNLRDSQGQEISLKQSDGKIDTLNQNHIMPTGTGSIEGAGVNKSGIQIYQKSSVSQQKTNYMKMASGDLRQQINQRVDVMMTQNKEDGSSTIDLYPRKLGISAKIDLKESGDIHITVLYSSYKNKEVAEALYDTLEQKNTDKQTLSLEMSFRKDSNNTKDNSLNNNRGRFDFDAKEDQSDIRDVADNDYSGNYQYGAYGIKLDIIA